MNCTTLPTVCTGLIGLVLSAGALAQSDDSANEQFWVGVTDADDDGAAQLLMLPGDDENGFTFFSPDEINIQGARAGGNVFFSRADGPKLGVTVEATEDGVIVKSVMDDSLASGAGVNAGDLILSIDKNRIHEIGDIGAALAHSPPGSSVAIKVVRKGEGVVKLKGALPHPATADAPHGRAHLPSGSGGPVLGVSLSEHDGGVIITGVFDDTGAWFAGIEKGDVLTSIDGHEVGTPDDVIKVIGEHETGDFVTLAFERDGKGLKRRARLGRRSGAGQGFSNLFTLPHAAPDSGAATGMRFAVPRGHLDRGDLMRRVPQRLNANKGLKLRNDALQGMLKRHGDADARHFDLDGMLEWMEEMQPGDNHHDVRIHIEDGVMTIERDGEVETYEVEDDVGSDNIFMHMPRPRHSGGEHDHDDDHDEHDSDDDGDSNGFERVSDNDEV